LNRYKNIILIATVALLFNACNFLLGSKDDDVTEEIFEAGSIDPNLQQNAVGYVPILPFWTDLSNPIDVYVGYDEMIYIIDDNGINVYDQKGIPQRQFVVTGATDIIQDRRIHTFVTGRVDKDIDGDGITENVAAVYHLQNTATADGPIFIDTLIHPLNDITRNNTAFRGADDEAVQFTGLAVLSDNTLYVSRTGPRNSITSISRPDNAVLFYNEEGTNIAYANGLNALNSSLKSALNISAIATEVGPPQSLGGVSSSSNFVLLQIADEAEFKALHILKFVDPESGVEYTEDATFTSMNLDRADRFMYEPFRFKQPADVYIAPDVTKYIFIVDSELDSLYQFTSIGYEGVNPPPTATTTKQIIASFGGEGSGPFQFNEPSGVCYFEETIFVADKGNNRICRYRLSTDIE